jgi:protease IV
VAVRRGVWIVLTLIFIAVMISAAGLVFMALLVGRDPQVASNSVLTIRLSGDLQELEPSSVLGQFMEPPPTVRSITDALRKAKVDRRITSVIIRPTGTAALWAKVQEVRDAIVDFKSSGKPVIAFMEYGGDQEYYLASACDKVFLMPTASLDLTGIASYELFLRGTLEKIGAFPDALHIGEYKTAANQYTERTMTPSHREMAESLNEELFEQLLHGLAQGRGKTDAEIRTLIDHGPFVPEEAVRVGLVDDLAYEDELDDKVQLGSGTLRHTTHQQYRQISTQSLGLDRGPKIAVIYAVGIIATGQSSADGTDVLGSQTIVEQLRRVRADNSIKAIVLRIDSPGGSALASDIIWREIVLTRDVKPVVASMSDVAASGGYYIAMPAHHIVAQPATLTGSIGVVAVKFVLDGTFDKLGMNIEEVKSGKYAGMYSSLRPFTPEERQKMLEHMQGTYETFVEKAAAGRKMTPEQIDAVAQGRVWMGSQARELGLVDELGGLNRALAVAKSRAGIAENAEVDLVVYPQPKSFFELVQSPFGTGAGGLMEMLLGVKDARAVRALSAPLEIFRRGEPLAIMPNVFTR